MLPEIIRAAFFFTVKYCKHRLKQTFGISIRELVRAVPVHDMAVGMENSVHVRNLDDSDSEDRTRD